MPEELAEILRLGWYTAECGALLLLGPGGHARSWECGADEIGQREYEINDVRVPDLDLDEERAVFLGALACRATGFAKGALRLATASRESADLRAVVSLGIGDDYLSHGATVKFFTMRGSYPDWFDDLERFENEAMMVLTMSDPGTPSG